jgi:Putative peptidoglycan binding domain
VSSEQKGSVLLPLLALFGVGAGILYVTRKPSSLRNLPTPPWWALPAIGPFAIPFGTVKVLKMGYASIVQQAQQKLNDLGYGPLALTGETDAPTKAAVIAFQQAKRLSVDGVIGPQTLAALGITLPTPVQVSWNSYQPSIDEAAQALATAYQNVTGQAPSKAILALLMAQTSWETRKSATGWNLPNFNWGGIKATPWDALYQIFPTHEGQGASQVTLPLRFAAYGSLAEGAEAYIRTLKSRSAWWAGLQSGTPQGLLQGLTTAPAYFTGNATQYLNGVRSLAAQYAGTAAKYGV